MRLNTIYDKLADVEMLIATCDSTRGVILKDKMTADNIPMECILVEWGFRSPEELSKLHPYGIIQTPMQLLNFID